MRFALRRYSLAMQILAAAVVLGVIGGCGNRSIIGKWRMSGGAEATVWEFSSNGAVRVGDVRGRYQFGDQGRIKIETPFATAVYQLEISGDHMTLQEPGGAKLEFTRDKGSAAMIGRVGALRRPDAAARRPYLTANCLCELRSLS